MHNVSHAIDLLVAGTEEYGPSKVGDGVARLRDLDLFVDIREVQAMEFPAMSAFISEFNASARQGRKGITITQVGRGDDMPSALADAVAQWTLGVLPVLVHWRGKHSCLSGSRQLDTQGGAFDVLAGPVIARGYSRGESQPPADAASLWELLLDVLQKHRLAQRLHWLELFTSKFDDGTVEATCRLNNRDWPAGRTVLADVATAWPTTEERMRSCRQFAMLLPKKGDTQEIALPTFWTRLFGRA
jgi:hypothetical protein